MPINSGFEGTSNCTPFASPLLIVASSVLLDKRNRRSISKAKVIPSHNAATRGECVSLSSSLTAGMILRREISNEKEAMKHIAEMDTNNMGPGKEILASSMRKQSKKNSRRPTPTDVIDKTSLHIRRERYAKYRAITLLNVVFSRCAFC